MLHLEQRRVTPLIVSYNQKVLIEADKFGEVRSKVKFRPNIS